MTKATGRPEATSWPTNGSVWQLLTPILAYENTICEFATRWGTKLTPAQLAEAHLLTH